MRSVRSTLVILACAIALPASAENASIGFIKALTGTATVTHGEAATAAVLAMPVYENDWIQTDDDSEIGVTFRDDTRIALGPNSRIHLAHFVFKPATPEYGFIMRLAYGTVECISGLTAKLAPDAMSIETPGFTVGARGTRFLIRSEK